MDKKVCILTSVHQALDIRIFYKEALTLKKAGYKVTLIAQHKSNEINKGIKIIALPKPKNRLNRILVTTWKVFKLALKEKANIYHFHDPELIPIGLLLKIFTRYNVIYDVHEDVEATILTKEWIPKFFRFILSKTFAAFESWASKKFDYIIAATPHIKSKFNVSSVTDIKNYPVICSKKHRKYPVFNNKSEYSLIYVGVLSEERGVKTVIESLRFIKFFRKAKLVLIGRFYNKKFEQDCKKLKENYGLRIEFKGLCLPDEVFEYLIKADVGMVCLHPLPNIIEALPNKLFEYMLAGLPIIASNFPIWKKIIEENKCGICVDPLNPREIAKAIDYLIEHPDKARKMGENGRKIILEKYNWENESKKLLKIYEELCAQ